MEQLIPSYTQWISDNENEAKSSTVLNDEQIGLTINEAILDKEITYEDIIHWVNEPVLESAIGKIIGGLTGAVLGKRVGKIIAKVMGVEKGVLYDMLTSRVFAIRLGVALGKRR